jgi:ABC-type glutathione transport system ATPase component
VTVPAQGCEVGPAPLLEVRNRTVRFTAGARTVTVFQDVSFSVQPGQVIALIGESGAGKTTTALALLRLLP